MRSSASSVKSQSLENGSLYKGMLRDAKLKLRDSGYETVNEDQIARIAGSMFDFIYSELDSGNEFTIPKIGKFTAPPKLRFFYTWISRGLIFKGPKHFVRRNVNIEKELKVARAELRGQKDERTLKPLGYDELQKDWKIKIPYES